MIKQEKKLLEQKNVEEAQKLLPQLYKALDKAALKGVLKPNAAARKKSRLTKLLQKTARLDSSRQAKMAPVSEEEKDEGEKSPKKSGKKAKTPRQTKGKKAPKK